MNFFAFARRHVRPLAFGLLHAFFSAPGQTYVIGIFVASFATSFALDPAAIGAVYLGATLASAATLLLVGHWIDHIRLVHFSAVVVVGLAVACFLVATASGVVSLLIAFYALRLSGQGLMIHVEATATARSFDQERGRALGITGLGIPLSEFVFPPVAVAGIAVIGWRPTYAVIGAVVLFVLLPLTQWLVRSFPRLPRSDVGRQGAWRTLGAGLAAVARTRFVWMALPAMAIMPFCGTAIMFYISTIVADRGWSMALVAASFPILALTNVAGLFVSGHIIDRLSARKLFLVQALPHIGGIVVLAVVTEAWALPVAFALMGISGGLIKTTMTAIWAEIFGLRILGTVRSAVAMYMVFASALGPFVFGVALSAGMSLSAILALFAVVSLIFLIPPVVEDRRAFAG